tara:strand:- start:1431 stop:1823 length:393 start_codon:yes stop_codon:yes gene_type:complete
MALNFEARKVALKQDRTGFVLTLAIHPDECPEEILRDFVGARYGCALVRIQDDESPMQYNNRVQKAGILCREPKFYDFLEVKDEEDAIEEVCNRCGIQSRTELHGNIIAKHLFDNLVREYDNFIQTDDPF